MIGFYTKGKNFKLFVKIQNLKDYFSLIIFYEKYQNIPGYTTVHFLYEQIFFVLLQNRFLIRVRFKIFLVVADSGLP